MKNPVVFYGISKNKAVQLALRAGHNGGRGPGVHGQRGQEAAALQPTGAVQPAPEPEHERRDGRLPQWRRPARAGDGWPPADHARPAARLQRDAKRNVSD